MKTKLFFTALMIMGFVTLSLAQRGHRNGPRGNGNGYYTYTTYGNNNSNNRYDHYLDRMNRSDRKRLRNLIRKLEERERCAWEDGRVSRREVRRINEVRDDIDRLVYRYRRNDRSARPNRYSSRSCR